MPSIRSKRPLIEMLLAEVLFRTSRSGGPGGQNVNKLETRVELLFDVRNSPSLSTEQKERMLATPRGRVDAKGIVHIVSQASRSQWENKRLVIEKFIGFLRSALKVRKKRIKSSPTPASNQRRIQRKKKHGQKKLERKVRSYNE